jgi:23S rRNA pseudouridine955/2504/2580 synthase
MDGLLKSLPNKKGETPRLVHRLDRDTSGCLVVAKTKAAASHFGAVFRSRSARKIYWAIVAGNPQPKQGRISCFLAKQATTDGEQMVVVENGHPGAVHSMSYYSVTDLASRRFAWVTLKPVTGRTHQLRVHMAQLGTPIIGDPRYFNIENWEAAPGLGEGLHLHARRIAVPLRNGKRLDVSAPLPPHMQQSFDALGFDADRYDVQDDDPEQD